MRSVNQVTKQMEILNKNNQNFSRKGRKKEMSNRSRSKQNFTNSYFDMTSPLSNLQKAKYKSNMKNSIHNSFMDKLQMYKDETKNANETLLTRSHASLTSLKASSALYKLPEFSAPQVNYEISQAIKQKANQIKQEMVNNLPNLLSSSSSLPLIGSKSSNFNPKKIQNLFGHRSSILQLQAWLKNSLLKNPPTSPDQLIEYKQMIMGVGMKELIRLINSRCLQEGKLVEQVWQLTWGICKEIIMHMALRAKKCQQILSQEISDYTMGYKRNFQEKEKELIQLRKKIQELQDKNKQMAQEVQDLRMQNEKLTIENNRNSQQSNYVNEQFLNVLEENLAMYLHLGDNNKMDWVKKMYKQMNKAKGTIQETLKQKVNKAVEKRIREENFFEDKQIIPDKFEVDREGNYAVLSLDRGKSRRQNAQKGQKADPNDQVAQGRNGDEVGLSLKEQLQQEFALIDCQAQTEKAQTLDEETQSEIKIFQDKETCQEPIQCIELGINTEEEQVKEQKAEKGKQKNKNQKKNTAKGSLKQKISKRSGDFSQEAKQVSLIPSSNDIYAYKDMISEEEQKVFGTEEQKKNKSKTIDYVCKECLVRKPKDEAIKDINLEEELQKLKQQITRLKASKEEQRLHDFEFDQIYSKNLYDNKNINDINEKMGAQEFTNQNSSSSKKTIETKNNSKAKISLLKDDLNKSIKNINKGKDEKKISPRSGYENEKGKRGLQSIEERMMMEQTDYGGQLQRYKKEKRRTNFQNDDNSIQIDSPQFFKRQSSPGNKATDSYSFRSGKKDINQNRQKKSSSIIHDISIKKETELTSQSREGVYNLLKDQQEDNDTRQVVAKLPISQKEPYFRFFTQQIKEANRDVIEQISSQQMSNELTLNSYFNIVQEVNSIPEARIYLSDKQMLTIIEKNLMPIILELLNTVKKSVFKKTVDQSIKTFYSLPFILMNKFSTKYGVKILAIKNMKLLLSSLKKIELITDRYKSLRLMLFTDCRAIFSEDLFVYLLVLAVVTPQLDLERPITLQQATQIRQICEKYLTKDKKVYQQFEIMTKQAFDISNTWEKFNSLKLAPVIRSIITSYRMAKINRIEEVGFIFLMLKRENYLEYLTFSFFMSCLKIQTDLKVKIVKTFLGNCDLKTKNKRVAMSESGFSRFLIRCPEFNFEFLNSIITKQSSEIYRRTSSSFTKKFTPTSKRISDQSVLQKSGNTNTEGVQQSPSQQRLQSERQILLQTQKILTQRIQLVEGEKLSDWQGRQQIGLDEIRGESVGFSRSKRHMPTNDGLMKSGVAQKTKNYSYFTYEISMFLQNQEQTKYMSAMHKQFVINYLTVHVMSCEVQQMIGLIDYFSRDMLEIICCDQSELRIQQGEIMQ